MSTFSGKETDEFVLPPLPSEAPPPRGASARVRAEVGALSHPGKVRPNNEDHFLVVQFGRAMQTLLTNLPAGQVPQRVEEGGYGLVVADGIGGSVAGEVASSLALSTLMDLVLRAPDWILKIGEPQAEQVMERLAERYRQVDEVLNERAQSDWNLSGMGTTMTVAFNLGTDLFTGHLGDSRAYLFRGGQLLRLTRDHTAAQVLAELGDIRMEEVATHRLRHVLTQCLGTRGAPVDAEVRRWRLRDGDRVLLCTDGLTDMVAEADVAAVLRDRESPQEACQALVDRALDNGGKDNVTVALAAYRFEQLKDEG